MSDQTATQTENPTVEETEEGISGEIYDGDDLFGSGTGGDDYEYALTAFIPKATQGRNSKDAPPDAARWVVPDLRDIIVVRALKIFKTSWLDKIPASYNTLYVRVGKKGEAEPTDLQAKIIKTVVAKYTGPDGLPNISQSVLIPIINLYDEEPQTTIAEMTWKAYLELKKSNEQVEDTTDGVVSLSTRPVYLWKSGDKGEITVKFDKSGDYDVAELLKDYERPDIKGYVKTRQRATEKWFVDRWSRYVRGEVGGELPESAEERFIDAVANTPTPVLRRMLTEAKVDLTGVKLRAALMEVAMANRELIEAAVLANIAPE